jgi:ribosome-binding factor A
MPFRQQKITDQIMQLAAKFFLENSNKSSLLTVTSASLSDDEKRATIFFTVYPTDKEEEALEFTKRRRSDFKAYVKENSRLGRIPFFDFSIDIGEKNRQLIDDLTKTY